MGLGSDFGYCEASPGCRLLEQKLKASVSSPIKRRRCDLFPGGFEFTQAKSRHSTNDPFFQSTIVVTGLFGKLANVYHKDHNDCKLTAFLEAGFRTL